ncbi:hypothetical protein ACWDFL_37220 [Streptomyces bungoensis]
MAVVAHGGHEPGEGALFVFVVLAGCAGLLHPRFEQTFVGEHGGQGAACRRALSAP